LSENDVDERDDDDDDDNNDERDDDDDVFVEVPKKVLDRTN
jgi:hypothetical protein